MQEDERERRVRLIVAMGLVGLVLLPVFLYHRKKGNVKKALGYDSYSLVQDEIKTEKKKFVFKEFVKEEAKSVKSFFKKTWVWLKK